MTAIILKSSKTKIKLAFSIDVFSYYFFSSFRCCRLKKNNGFGLWLNLHFIHFIFYNLFLGQNEINSTKIIQKVLKNFKSFGNGQTSRTGNALFCFLYILFLSLLIFHSFFIQNLFCFVSRFQQEIQEDIVKTKFYDKKNQPCNRIKYIFIFLEKLKL